MNKSDFYDGLSSEDIKCLESQIQNEYKESRDYLDEHIKEWGRRLKLYSNQKRDKTSIGNPLLFTVFSTVFPVLYNDKLICKFAPNETGDEDQAKLWNHVLEYDYEKMLMPINKYDWSWDAAFFGRGYLLMADFDTKKCIPLPEVLNPMVCLRDPNATSINGGLKRNGGARYFGWECLAGRYDIENSGLYDMDVINKFQALTTDSLINDNSRSRDNAQNRNNNVVENKNSNEDGDVKADNIGLIKWYTMYKGKRIFCELIQDKKNIARCYYLDEIYENDIPIIDRSLSPIPHDYDGVSIPDLVEDKQRAGAILINDGLKIAKRAAQPMYLFNTMKITNKGSFKIEAGKHIPVNGDPSGAIQEVQTSGISSSVDYVLNFLNLSAEKSTGASGIRQGVGTGKTTSASEAQGIMAGTDDRFALYTKVFGWSEKEFCRMYLMLYKQNLKNSEDKIIRVEGALGYELENISKDSINDKFDPDILVESSTLLEEKRAKELAAFTNFYSLASSNPDLINPQYALKEYGKIMGVPETMVNAIIPPTADELDAEDENKGMLNNIVPVVEETDDDIIHIQIHNKLPDDNPFKKEHIDSHIAHMILKAREQKKSENALGQTQQNEQIIDRQANMQSMLTKMSNNGDNITQ